MSSQPIPILLSGGIGSRLWPLSNKETPKQFLKIASKLSPFQKTVIRNEFLGRPTIIVSGDHLQLMNRQLVEIGVTDVDIIVEPTRKNTAAVATLAALQAQKEGVNSVLLLPCDHEIIDEAEYKATICKAIKANEEFQTVTIGIEPDGFSSEYGYIETKPSNNEAERITRFKEKPKNQNAIIFENGRNYFWNSGIYLLQTEDILSKLANTWSESYSHIENAYQFSKRLENITYPAKTHYSKCESASFDIVFAERAENMGMVKAKFDWSDLGTWPSLVKYILTSTSIAYDWSEHARWILHNGQEDEETDCPAILNMRNVLAISHHDHIIIAKKDSFEKVMSFHKEDFYIRNLGRNLVEMGRQY